MLEHLQKVLGLSQTGGQGSGRPTTADAPAPASDMHGGRRHRSRRHRSARRSKSSSGTRRHTRRHRVKKGGSGLLATAAVPLGLLGLQKVFQGRSSHSNVRHTLRSARRHRRSSRR
jgi:hypothetical protein